jgi:hypothetical protein
MPDPVDLLLITHNRRRYVEKTLETLVRDPAAFRVYWWDNHSTDGATDVVRALLSERLSATHLSDRNVYQGVPTRWFLETSRSDVVGKIDDDVLLPIGWLDRFTPLVRENATLGMLGCWMFMPEDWDEEMARQNCIRVAGLRIFRVLTMGGCSFVARREVLLRFLLDEPLQGLPVDKPGMSLAGFISGYPVPLEFAHHMDDPRSPHCRMRDPKSSPDEWSYTMGHQRFDSLDEYARWIEADARYYQETPFNEQLRIARLRRDPTVLGRMKWMLVRRFGTLRLPPSMAWGRF